MDGIKVNYLSVWKKKFHQAVLINCLLLLGIFLNFMIAIRLASPGARLSVSDDLPIIKRIWKS